MEKNVWSKDESEYTYEMDFFNIPLPKKLIVIQQSGCSIMVFARHDQTSFFAYT